MVDDCSVAEEETIIASTLTELAQQQADEWPRGMATTHSDVPELIMRDLVRREGFQRA